MAVDRKIAGHCRTAWLRQPVFIRKHVMQIAAISNFAKHLFSLCAMACLWTPGPAMPQSPSSSRWEQCPLLFQDYREEMVDDIVVPVRERILLFPVIQNYLWKGECRSLAVADPVVFENTGRRSLRDLCESLETNGQSVASFLLLAKGHAPDAIFPRANPYAMKIINFEDRLCLVELLHRLTYERWIALQRDLRAELQAERLAISRPGWDDDFDKLVEENTLLNGEGYKLGTDIWEGEDGAPRFLLWPFNMGTEISICLTAKGWQALCDEILIEVPADIYQSEGKRALDDWKAAEKKVQTDQTNKEISLLQRVRAAVAFSSMLPDGKEAGEKRTLQLPDGERMSMVWCPAGVFWMGSPLEEAGHHDDETRHRVTLTRGFWMAETEVTQRQWTSVMESNPSCHKGDKLPVVNVSWHEAQYFCLKVGQGLQLPTEAQWEYACRAGCEAPYAGTGVLVEMGWFHDNSQMVSFFGGRSRKAHPVGKKAPNAWGLFDMHGNVMEWCQDVYAPYPTGDAADPTGVEAGKRRVVRGGHYGSYAEGCRSAVRAGGMPVKGYSFCGFRPVVVGQTEEGMEQQNIVTNPFEKTGTDR